MFRALNISALGLVALSALVAGPIQIGSGTAGANGLTATYMASGCRGASDATTTAKAGYDGCMTPSGGALNERSWQTSLFENATPSVTPTVVGSSAITAAGFARDSNAVTDTGNGVWASNNGITASTDIIIPVGIYGIAKVYTMLNDYWGADGLQNTQVIFTFDDSSSGAGGTSAAVVDTFALTNGQQIRSAVDANTAVKTCITIYSGTGVQCPGASAGLTIATTLSAASTIASSTSGNSVAVYTNNLFTRAYTDAVGGTGANQYKGTTGNVNLDMQTFDFGLLHSNDFLVSITIRNQLVSGNATTTSGANQTRAALTAISVDQVPEPSTVFMAFAGLGALGYFRRRKA